MGRWGFCLFEGDDDLDEASYISEDAGIELYNYELEDEGSEFDFGGKGMEATREHLNGGVLSRLFEEYATKRPECVTKPVRYALLGALAMRVGATIEPKHLEILRKAAPRIPEGMRQQIREAVKHYKNDGKPYRFSSRGLIDTLYSENDELGEEKLKLCKGCNEVAYCTKDCQKADWSKHKKTCGKPKPAAPAPPAASGGIKSFNV